jgi:hypothetical protein
MYPHMTQLETRLRRLNEEIELVDARREPSGVAATSTSPLRDRPAEDWGADWGSSPRRRSGLRRTVETAS